MIAPKLRFSEFKDEWNESNVGSLISNSSEKFNPLKETVNLPCVELEHLSQGTGEIIGYCSSVKQKSIKNKFNEKNVLFGKLRPYLKKYAKPNFKGVCSSEIWVLSSQRLNTNFLFQYIQTRAFLDLTLIQSGSKMPRAEWEMVADGTIFYPQEKEQTKIAEFLSAVDDKISQLSRQLELLNQYKKGVMQKIFSQEIRFKNDNGEDFGEWDYLQLGELIEESKAVSKKQDEFDVLTSSRRGLIKQSEYFEGSRLIDRDNVGFNIIKPHEITYRSRSDDGLFYFNFNNLGITGIISTYYPVFSFKNSNNKFVTEYLNFNKADFSKYAVGTSQLVLSLNALRTVKLRIPSKPEQEKIAEFLTAIDERIDHTTAQLTHTKQWKKGLLQQMFV